MRDREVAAAGTTRQSANTTGSVRATSPAAVGTVTFSVTTAAGASARTKVVQARDARDRRHSHDGDLAGVGFSRNPPDCSRQMTLSRSRWAGSECCVIRRKRPHARITTMFVTPVLHHVNLKTVRLQAMVEWYGRVFGWSTTSVPPARG